MALDILKKHRLASVQAILYLSCFVLGFFIVIPLGMMLRNFHGECILFAQIVWNNKVIFPWAETTCEFTLYSNLAVNIFYAPFLFFAYLIFLWPKTPSRHQDKVGLIESWNVRFMTSALNPVLSLVNILVCILMICSASTLSAGFGVFCNYLMESMAEEGVDMQNCLSGANLDWHNFRIRGGSSNGVRGERFHVGYIMAIFFSWINTICWIIQLCICLSQCCRTCSCEVAEEKKKMHKSEIIAARRSRFATPTGTPGGGFGTPGGGHTPVPMGAPMPQPYRPVAQYPPPKREAPLNPQVLMGPPQTKQFI